jgi:hypothetical protein
VVLTDEREYEVELPKPRRTTIVGGGGGSGGDGVLEIVPGDNIMVDNTDPQRPIVSATGGGESRQEIFIGTAPAINYPALVFESATIGGQQTYRMRVNVPV